MTRILILAVLLCGACSSAEQDPPGHLATITAEGVGCARLDATVSDLLADCDVVRDTAVTLEGMPQEALLLEIDSAGVLAEMEGGRVWRVSVLGEGPMTADSLGVGTPAHSLSELHDVRVFAGEERYFAVSPDHCGLSFELDGIPPGRSELGAEDLRQAPPDVRISRVLIVGECPALR